MSWPSVTRLWALSLTATLMLVTGGCGGDKQGTYSTPDAHDLTVLATRAVPTAGSEELAQLLLEPGDLGTGWIQPNLDQAGLTVGDSYFCDVQVAIPSPDAAVVLQNESKSIFLLFQVVTEFPSLEQAEEHVAANRDALRNCDRFVSTDGVRGTEFEIGPASLEPIGEESVAFKGRAQIESTQGPLDSEAFFVTTRYGQQIVLISATWIGEADEDDMNNILRAADRKLLAAPVK